MQKYPRAANGFIATFPSDPDAIVVTDRDPATIAAATSRALAMARAHHGRRIWLIREHQRRTEARTYDRAFAHTDVRRITDRPDGLTVVEL